MWLKDKDALSSAGPGTAHTGMISPVETHTERTTITPWNIYIAVGMRRMIPGGFH